MFYSVANYVINSSYDKTAIGILRGRDTNDLDLVICQRLRVIRIASILRHEIQLTHKRGFVGVKVCYREVAFTQPQFYSEDIYREVAYPQPQNWSEDINMEVA